MDFKRGDFNRFKGTIEKPPQKGDQRSHRGLRQPGALIGKISHKALAFLPKQDMEGGRLSSEQIPVTTGTSRDTHHGGQRR
jgi:hypothetical protein